MTSRGLRPWLTPDFISPAKKLSCFKRLRQMLVSLNLIAWYRVRWKNKRKKHELQITPLLLKQPGFEYKHIATVGNAVGCYCKRTSQNSNPLLFLFSFSRVLLNLDGGKKSIEKFQLGVSATAALRSISPCTATPALHCRR